MELETMRPNPAWSAAGYEEHVETFASLAGEAEIHIWGGDWCGDCRAQLPDFAAGLAAAGFPDEQIHQYPVEKHDDGSKSGPKVEAYGIERIPTVVVERAAHSAAEPERDGEELARFVEEASVPILVALADQLRATV